MGYWSADAPEARDIPGETLANLENRIKLAPEEQKAYLATQPGYDAGALQSLDTMLNGGGGQKGFLEQYPAVAKVMDSLSAMGNTSQRTADIGDLNALGPEAMAAYRKANPQLSKITDLLTNQSIGEMQDPYALTPEQKRYYTQLAAAANSRNGMAGQPIGAANEMMANWLASGQEAQRRIGNATNAASVLQSTSADPWRMLTGNSAGTGGTLAATGQANNASTNIAGMFDPFGSYENNANAQNNDSYNTWLANKKTGAQRAQFVSDSVGSFAGSVAKGIACWVAREVYGEGNPRWKMFRAWLLSEAPTWFQNLYFTHGPAFAAWIHDKPRLKAYIRWWMDGRIEGVERRKQERSKAYGWT